MHMQMIEARLVVEIGPNLVWPHTVLLAYSGQTLGAEILQKRKVVSR